MESQKIDAGLSRAMATMGLVCAILVVMIHADVTASGWQRHVMQLIRGFTRIAVPWFFLAAGFFLAGHVGTPGWWRTEVAKRVKSLLIPFFCWLWIYRLFDAVLKLITHLVGYKFGGGAYYGLGDEIIYLLGIHPFRLVPVLWFLRALFICVLISPLICKCGKKMTCLLLVGFFISYAWHETADAGRSWVFLEYFFSLRGVFYFFSGMALRRFDFRIQRTLWSVCFVGLLGGGLLWVKCHHPDLLGGSGVADVLMIPFLMYCVFRLAAVFVMPKSWTSYSLPIYLMHFPLLILLTGAFSICHQKVFFTTSLLAFCGKLVIVILMIIMLTIVLKRFCPRAQGILLGGR